MFVSFCLLAICLNTFHYGLVHVLISSTYGWLWFLFCLNVSMFKQWMIWFINDFGMILL